MYAGWIQPSTAISGRMCNVEIGMGVDKGAAYKLNTYSRSLAVILPTTKQCLDLSCSNETVRNDPVHPYKDAMHAPPNGYLVLTDH